MKAASLPAKRFTGLHDLCVLNQHKSRMATDLSVKIRYNKCKENSACGAKSSHLVVARMYKFDNGQISIHEFGQRIGMKLREGNRWVKKAMTIPWGSIERRYATLFTNQKGNVAKPLRLGLGACIIRSEYGFSDVEVTLQIQETA